MRNRDDDPTPQPEEEEIARLLKLAGRRPEIPGRLKPQIWESARRDWQAKVESVAARRRQTWVLALAATAVLALGTAFLLNLTSGTATAEVVATVAAAFPDDPSNGELAADSELLAGDSVSTGPQQRLALDLVGGAHLRLDQGTRLTLRSARLLELAAGAVYVDSGGRGGGLEIATPFGLARDIGTRFAVRLEGSTLNIEVRDGEVELEAAQQRYRAAAGTALILDQGRLERDEISSFDDIWNWTLAAAPPFELEGGSLQAFLEWVAEETGRELHFSDPQLAARAASIVTHGQLDDVRPDQALAIVLASSGLRYHLEAGELWVDD